MALRWRLIEFYIYHEGSQKFLSSQHCIITKNLIGSRIIQQSIILQRLVKLNYL